MPRDAPAPPDPRPPGTRELVGMFDDISGRYDLLNRVMSLGRDRAWRHAMWRRVPEQARVVLDLCTGSGASLAGLRRPGRLVLGVDVSLRMLDLASASHRRSGWAPRLVCADAFRLPFRGGSVDCVTVAFGVRNFRPRSAALAEIHRVLAPGGTLVVLEATAPRPGPAAPLHSLYIRHVIPLAGRLSPDPEAYAYLSRSILEFGSGEEFEQHLREVGLEPVERHSFLLGATGLWVARRSGTAGSPAPAGPPAVHAARMGKLARGEMPNLDSERGAEWRWWVGVQLALSATLVVTLGWASWTFFNSRAGSILDRWPKTALGGLLVVGTIGFAVRTVVLWLRFFAPPPRS